VIDTEPIPGTEASTTTNVGTADITLAGGSDDNYSISLNNGTLTINKAALTATADDKSRAYGDANPAFSISYTGFKNGEDASVIDTEPTASTTATSTTGVGTVDITLTGGTDNNYDISTLNNGTLTITKATLTAIADDKSKNEGESNPTLTISYSGFVNGEGESVIDTPPSISTIVDEDTQTGSYPIILSGGTDDNYGFSLINGVFTVKPGSFVTQVVGPTSGTFGIGQDLSFVVTFSQLVNISGEVSIPLTIGSSSKSAIVNGPVSNSTIATFSYSIEESDFEADGIEIGSKIVLNGGSVKGPNNVDAILDLNNVTDISGVLVDGIRPTAILSSDASSIVNESFPVTFTYSEVVSNFELSDISVVNGTASDFVTVAEGKVWSATITPSSAGEVQVSLLANVAEDLVGNGSSISNVLSRQFNTLPTDISLSSSSVEENNQAGDVIGLLSSTDPDINDSHTYSLVSGTGDTDNGSFTIDGSQLKAAVAFDFETKSSYSIRIKTDDGQGGTFEKEFTINILNVLEPNISVSGSITFDDTALGLGSSESFRVTNTGEKAIEVRVISTPGGFTAGLSSVILAVDETKDIPVTFRPLEARSYGGDLIVAYEGGERTVSLSGEGVVITSVEDDVVSSKDIITYPNPAKTRLQIDLSKLNGQSAEVSILQMSGLKMFDREVENRDSLSIDVSKFDQGLYIVLIKTKKSIVKKKVIVRR